MSKNELKKKKRLIELVRESAPPDEIPNEIPVEEISLGADELDYAKVKLDTHLGELRVQLDLNADVLVRHTLQVVAMRLTIAALQCSSPLNTPTQSCIFLESITGLLKRQRECDRDLSRLVGDSLDELEELEDITLEEIVGDGSETADDLSEVDDDESNEEIIGDDLA